MNSIRTELKKGIFWVALAKYSGIAIQLVITAVLARLIEPAAFGTIAVAMVILYFLNIFSDIGIGPAIVQYKQLNKKHLNTLFTLTIYIGTVLAAVLYISSDFIAGYYDESVLNSVCKIMSLIVLFNTCNVVPNALMRKDKRFRTIALRTLFFQVFGGAIAICAALKGLGLFALIFPSVVTSVGVFFINYYNYPLKFVFKIDMEAFKTVASFSIFQFAFSFFNYFSRNLDKLIIGKYFSLTQLGYYDKSYHLMLLPVQNITFVIEPVLHPILSSLQENKHELAEKNINLCKIISRISFPMGLLLFFCGSELIKIVYGDKWDAAIPIFEILALSLPLQMILSTSGAIFQVSGKTNHMFFNGLLNTLITVVGFFVAAIFFGTLESIAWAWVITLLINFVDSYCILCIVSLKDSVKLFLKSLMPQLLNSLLTFVLMCWISHFLRFNCLFLCLIIKSLCILFFSASFAIIFKQYNFISYIKNMRIINGR